MHNLKNMKMCRCKAETLDIRPPLRIQSKTSQGTGHRALAPFGEFFIGRFVKALPAYMGQKRHIF